MVIGPPRAFRPKGDKAEVDLPGIHGEFPVPDRVKEWLVSHLSSLRDARDVRKYDRKLALYTVFYNAEGISGKEAFLSSVESCEDCRKEFLCELHESMAGVLLDGKRVEYPTCHLLYYFGYNIYVGRDGQGRFHAWFSWRSRRAKRLPNTLCDFLLSNFKLSPPQYCTNTFRWTPKGPHARFLRAFAKFELVGLEPKGPFNFSASLQYKGEEVSVEVRPSVLVIEDGRTRAEYRLVEFAPRAYFHTVLRTSRITPRRYPAELYAIERVEFNGREYLPMLPDKPTTELMTMWFRLLKKAETLARHQ